MTLLQTLCLAFTLLYALDRAIKASLIHRFFARPLPPEPTSWPSVSLIQPVTRGATDLSENLTRRAALDYPGSLQHIILCDTADQESQTVCRIALPAAELHLVAPDAPGSVVATKVGKMTAGVAVATGDVLVFLDDDIGLPPDALQTLVRSLSVPGVGATFGLANQATWANGPSALLSAFVNANALTGYIPLAECTEPYTITGHCFALSRQLFEEIGGMNGLGQRFDDDHEIARRVCRAGQRLVQTPLVYRVANYLPTWRAYFVQMRRWFVMPREAMLPYLSPRENTLTTLLSLGNVLPPLILALAIWHPTPTTTGSVFLTLLLSLGMSGWLEARYLSYKTPGTGYLLMPLVLFLVPLQIAVQLLLPGDRIEWRGQRLRARRGGGLEISE